MKVQGVEITEAQIQVCIDRMKLGRFGCYDIEIAAGNAGVPGAGSALNATAMRLADRLIQRERKAGNLKYLGKSVWKWVADAEGKE